MTRDVENTVPSERVFETWDYPIFLLLSVASLGAILYFMWTWFSQDGWTRYPISFAVITLLLLVVLVNNQGRWYLLLFMKRPKPMPARAGWKVGVGTTFVPGSESLEMLERTLDALVRLEYPHDTWVLDEGDHEDVKALCERLGVNHFSRKNSPHYQAETGPFQSHWKHGNFNAWLHEIANDRYDIVTVFDPDHVPATTFLLEVLGYFEDPSIAYVQVAQAYYNQKASFIACGAAEEVYSYYSSIQMAGYGLGYPVVIGGHTTHRIAALKEVGGFPPHNADDILITLLYRARNWQGVYLPKILARGLTPVDWEGYLTQQRRWSRSVLDIKLRFYPEISKNLPLGTRVISFLHGLNYLHKSFFALGSVVGLIYVLATGRIPDEFTIDTVSALAVLYLALQVSEFYRQRFYLDWHNEWGLHWRTAVLQYAKWPFLLLAFLDVVFGRRVPFALTGKARTGSRRYVLLWPHLLIVGLVSAAWAIGTVTGNLDSPVLHSIAAVIVTWSFALISTEFWTYPEPYDGRLLSEPS